jgi:hypothetical protein
MSIPVSVVADASGQAFSDYIRVFVGNIVMALIAVGAARFLLAREMVRFFEFAAIAILVGVFVWVPAAPQHIAQTIGGFFT